VADAAVSEPVEGDDKTRLVQRSNPEPVPFPEPVEGDDATRLVTRSLPEPVEGDDATRLVTRLPSTSSGSDPADDATRLVTRPDLDDRTVLSSRATVAEPITNAPVADSAARQAFVPEGVSATATDRYGIRDSTHEQPTIERTSYGTSSNRSYAKAAKPARSGRRVLVGIILVTVLVAIVVAVAAIIVVGVL
jgi:hypothetical protein